MTPEAIAALLQLGLAGLGLYLFVAGILLSKTNVEAERKREGEDQAKLVALYEARIVEADERYEELRAERDQWRALALGTERRLDQVVPAVATAVGAAVPSLPPAPPGGGQQAGQ